MNPGLVGCPAPRRGQQRIEQRAGLIYNFLGVRDFQGEDWWNFKSWAKGLVAFPVQGLVDSHAEGLVAFFTLVSLHQAHGLGWEELPSCRQLWLRHYRWQSCSWRLERRYFHCGQLLWLYLMTVAG